MNEKRQMLSGTIITLLGAGLWGLNAVVSKYLMACGIDTMWMVNFRMIASGFVLLGQSFHPTETAGAAAILAGIAILTVAKTESADA